MAICSVESVLTASHVRMSDCAPLCNAFDNSVSSVIARSLGSNSDSPSNPWRYLRARNRGRVRQTDAQWWWARSGGGQNGTAVDALPEAGPAM